MPITGLSPATQNIILLRHIEQHAALLRVMAILKVVGGEFPIVSGKDAERTP